MARTPEQNIARREKEAEAKRQKRAAAKAKAAPPRKPAAKKEAVVNGKMKALGKALKTKAKGKRKSPAAPVAAKVPVKRTVRGKGGDTSLDPALHKSANTQAFEAAEKRRAAETAPVTISKGSPPVHTMARSYVRRSGAGQGKERHGTYQCTVSFTEPQMVQIRAASQLRGVSLAEMIRSAVVGHLNRGIPS